MSWSPESAKHLCTITWGFVSHLWMSLARSPKLSTQSTAVMCVCVCVLKEPAAKLIQLSVPEWKHLRPLVSRVREWTRSWEEHVWICKGSTWRYSNYRAETCSLLLTVGRAFHSWIHIYANSIHPGLIEIAWQTNVTLDICASGIYTVAQTQLNGSLNFK